MKNLNRKVTTVLLTGILSVGSMSMVYANDDELQEVFQVYTNNNEEGVRLSSNPMATAEDDTQINVVKGENIEIELEENVTTGCTWHVTIENEDIVKLDSDEYVDINDEDLAGAAGLHIWNFKALSEGSTKVTFELYQSWNPENVYETKEYTITVDANTYEDNSELQEIFEVYDDDNKEEGMFLSTPPVTTNSSKSKEFEYSLFGNIQHVFSYFFSF